MSEMWGSIVTIAVGIIGVATLAVLVSNSSNASGVISAATGGFARDLQAAVSPVTGGMGGFSLTGGGASSITPY